MRVAIMQPTYLPWSGYFGLMRSVDLFIFLDTVQFARRSWQQRNQIKTATGPQWLTVPVLVKGKRDQLISDVEIEQTANFAAIHRRSIELSYRKAPFFDTFAAPLLSALEQPQNRLAELTISIAIVLKEQLRITTPIMRASNLQSEGVKADLLASLCRQTNATEYVSPPGSQGYLDQSIAFENAGIPVRYFHFAHPQYPQLFGEFIPYMSCIDMLFNCGDRTLPLIEAGCEIA
jgi:hypothetical protein